MITKRKSRVVRSTSHKEAARIAAAEKACRALDRSIERTLRKALHDTDHYRDYRVHQALTTGDFVPYGVILLQRQRKKLYEDTLAAPPATKPKRTRRVLSK